MDEKIQNALNFIQTNTNKYNKNEIIALTSFGKDSLVLVDLVRRVDETFKFVWIKPPFLPEATITLANQLTKEWHLNLDIAESRLLKDKSFMENVVYKPKAWETNAEGCCQIFKVQPIIDYVREHNVIAWFAGLRNTESEKRGFYTPVWYQGEFTKLHPILDWTEEEIWKYIDSHNLPKHPYYDRGYRSLGCEYCSRPAGKDEPERAGRWYGTTLAAGECTIPEALVVGEHTATIHNVTVGDSVFSDFGESTVTKTFKREYNGSMFRIKGYGTQPLYLTPNHPILIYKANKNGLESIKWVLAKEAQLKKRGKTGHYLIIPRLEGVEDIHTINLLNYVNSNREIFHKHPLEISVNQSTAWLFGAYCAEGSATNGKITFSLGKHETELRIKISEIIRKMGYSPYIHEVRTASNLTFTSNVLSKLMRKWFGNKSHTKQIPNFILLHKNHTILQSFLDGYFEGDGCTVHVGKNKDILRKTANTTSLTLASQLQLLCARLGIFLSVYHHKRAKKAVIEGRTINQRDRYMLSYYPYPQHTKSIILNDKIVTPINKIQEQPYNGLVCNLQTTSGKYLLSNTIVHNCGIHCIPPLGTKEQIQKALDDRDREPI